MRIMWKRIFSFDSLKELYESVTPEEDRNNSLLSRFPDIYRAFSYNNNGNIEAFGVIGLLKENNAFMIDLFALDKSIRNKGLARPIFQSFIENLPKIWPEINKMKDSWLLEAYLHNIVPWCKIMNMEIAETKIPAIKLANPIQLLSHNIKNIDETYSEWQKFQLQW